MRYFLISIDTLRADVAEEVELQGLFHRYCNSYYTSSNWTLPAHAALLVGNTSHNCNWDWGFPESKGMADQIMDQKEGGLRGRTIAEEMKYYGYDTVGIVGGGFVSKWFGFNRGFDVWEEKNPFPIKNAHRADFPDNCFILLHDYFVHNYFEDSDWPILKMRESEFMDPESIDPSIIRKGKAAYVKRAREMKRRLKELIAAYPRDKFIVVADHGEAFVERPKQIHHGVYTDMRWPEVARVPLGLRNVNIDTDQVLFDIDIKDMILYGSISQGRTMRGRYSYWGKHYDYRREGSSFSLMGTI